MEINSGLILGIEIKNKTAQICVFDGRLNAPVAVNEAHQIYSNGIDVDKLISSSSDEVINPLDEMKKIITTLINDAVSVTGNNKIISLSIVVYRYEIALLDLIKQSLKELGLYETNWQIINRDEAFAYYAYSQKRELYLAGVVLMNYDENGLDMYRLSCQRRNNTDYINEEHKHFVSDKLTEAVNNEDIDMASDELCGYLDEFMKGKTASTIYLTGKGFDIDKLPDNLTRAIVNRRKAFIGQNLYVKGACFAAYEKVNPHISKNTCFLGQEKTLFGVETDITQMGSLKRLRITKAGTSWYMAERVLDFILDDERVFNVKLITPDNKCFSEDIDISRIPFRPGKTTRISFEVKFMAADRCLITIKDKGFGSFYKSSGEVIYKEIDFNDILTQAAKE